MIKPVLTICFLLLLGNLKAQENEVKPVENAFRGTRYVNGQSAKLASESELILQIQHRFGDISGGLYELFGLDQANMRIGFEYGFADWLNVGVGRSNMMKTYDGFAKIRIAQQTENFPLTMVTTIGSSLPTIRDYFPVAFDNFSDKFSGNIQLHLAKTMGDFSVQLSPGYLKTGYLPFENEDYSFFTLGFGGSVKLSKKVSWNLEYLHRFNSELKNNKPLSTSVDIDTGGHIFQLVLSNSQAMFDQSLFTNTMGDWTKGNIYFGFNLIREFKLKYDYY